MVLLMTISWWATSAAIVVIQARKTPSPPPGNSRNAQFLARLDLVRVAQHVAVGFEDPGVQPRLTVEVAGDLGKRVALLHDVRLGVGILRRRGLRRRGGLGYRRRVSGHGRSPYGCVVRAMIARTG